MNDFKEELERYGEQMRGERCPLSDAQIDKAIRRAMWQAGQSKESQPAAAKRRKRPWVAVAACVVALLVPQVVYIANRATSHPKGAMVFACNEGCNPQAVLARLDNII